MGMSSSQARLLTLTGRMHDIEYKAAKLEAQKLQMANESRRVYETYLEALDATKIQYQTINSNGEIQYNDASYYDLCLGNSPTQFGLFSTQNGYMYIPQSIKDKYDAASSASDFATSMTGYTPPIAPSPTTPTPSPSSPSAPTPGSPYTPSGTVPSETDPDVTPTTPGSTDITLSRGNNSGAVSIDSTGITLCLTNPFSETSGQQYYYTVKANGVSNTTASFRFLGNGRLVISGNNLEITAKENQADDIILQGNNNVLDTGNKNDIVRVGYVVDDPTRSSTYNGDWYSLSNNNTINTGTGSDHIIVGGSGNSVNGGSGTFTDSTVLYGATSASDIEQDIGAMNTSTSYNYYVDAAMQGSELGDCRYLSLLNSLRYSTKGTSANFLNEFVDITHTGSNYEVVFKNYTGGNNSVSFTQSEMDAVDYANGDPDVRIIEFALNKLIYTNSGHTQNLQSDSYQDYSRYMFGTPNTSMYVDSTITGTATISGTSTQIHIDDNTRLSKSLMQHLWSKYQSGTISNIVCGADVADSSLQIVSGHAYAVSNVTNDYIELINPWDNQDRLRLSWTDFMSHYAKAYVFGDTSSDTYTNHLIGGDLYNGSMSGATTISELYNENITLITETGETINLIPETGETINMIPETGETINMVPETGETISMVAETGETDPTIVISYDGLTDAERYSYYYNLYNAIHDAGGCEIVPEDMMASTEYLRNVINGGFAYLKTYDRNEGKWVDTSVATHTALREVDDEKDLRKAEAKYEADMRKIDAKDRRYDTELAALDGERNAIKSEMDTLKNVAKDNVERTFKLFS